MLIIFFTVNNGGSRHRQIKEGFMKNKIKIAIALLGVLFVSCSQEDEKIRREIEQIATAREGLEKSSLQMSVKD